MHDYSLTPRSLHCDGQQNRLQGAGLCGSYTQSSRDGFYSLLVVFAKRVQCLRGLTVRFSKKVIDLKKKKKRKIGNGNQDTGNTRNGDYYHCGKEDNEEKKS